MHTLVIVISHVQCAKIIDKHNSLLSRQPDASSFGNAIGKALNKKLSQSGQPDASSLGNGIGKALNKKFLQMIQNKSNKL